MNAIITRVNFAVLISTILTLVMLFPGRVQPVGAQTSCSTASDFGTVAKTSTATTAGKYSVWLRLWVPDGVAKSVKLSVNTICKDLPGATTLGASKWVWTNSAADNTALTTDLTANQAYETIVSGLATKVRLDRVLLLTDGCIPTGTGDNCTVVDTTAPTISISKPLNGATVSGQVVTNFTISDLADTSKVELLIDGVSAATSTTSPFAITWDSTKVTDGSYSFQARLTDKDTNVSLSSNFTINVANKVPEPDPVPTPGDGVVSRIPVDAYKEGGEGVAYHDSGAGNKGNCDTRNDDVDLRKGSEGCIVGWNGSDEWIEYDLNISVAGTYTFLTKVARAGTGTGSMLLQLDGTKLGNSIVVPSTGSSDIFTVVTSSIVLPVGQHALRVNTEKGYYDISWFEFNGPGTVSIGEITTPPPATNVTSIISLDSYNNGGQGVGYNDTTTGNQGDGNCRAADDVDMKTSNNGCVITNFATNEWLNYDVEISKAGTYNYQLNAARGESGEGAFQLKLDGNNITDRVNVPSTGDWQVFTPINGTVELTAGAHTLRLLNLQQFIDVDWLQLVGPGTVTLTQTPPLPPEVDTTPPSQPQNLSATNVTDTSIGLTWSESVDSGVGVVGYAIYRDGVLLQAVPSNSFTDTKLLAGVEYRYTVSALDAVGNESTKATLTVKTVTVTPPGTPSLSADMNGDGVYDSRDFAIFKGYYRSKDLRADFDGNKILDVRDWALFLAAWKEGR